MNGKTIKQFREHHGFKQVEVALIAGISQSRLSLIENGWVRPRSEEISRIKAAFAILAKGNRDGF